MSRHATPRVLLVTRADGSTESILVRCGAAYGARRLPARIGRALASGAASAVLDYDGRPRTAVRTSGRYYMRRAD